MSVSWRPLLSIHSRKCFWKFCITHCSTLWENAAISTFMFSFKSTVVFGFFSCAFALEITPEEEVVGVDMQGSCRPFNISPWLDQGSWEHRVEDPQCESLPCLPETRESGFHHLLPQNWIFASCVLRTWLRSSLSRSSTGPHEQFFFVYSDLVIYFFNHNLFVRMEIWSARAIFGAPHDKAFLMQWHFCLLIAEDFWQKPDALVLCSQEP